MSLGVSQGGNVSKPQSNSGNQELPSAVGAQEAAQAAVGEDVQRIETKKQNVARTLSQADIAEHLLSLNKSVTQDNKQIILTMIKHGIEISPQAFESIEMFVKGEKQNKIEPAVIAYSKGLEGNNKAVNLISDFLSHQINLSQLMDKTTRSLSRLRGQTSLLSGQLDAGLLTGLASVVGDFLTEFKKLKKMKENLDVKSMLSKQSSFVQDLKYFQELLKGIEKKVDSSKNLKAADLSELLKSVNGQLSDFHDSLITQLILSKNPSNVQIAEEFFHYWMLPNPLAQSQTDMQLMISKDPRNKKRINPENTKIVINFETNDLGNLTIIVEISDKKVNYKFYSQKELTQKFVLDYSPELKKSMESLSYEVVGVQSLRKHLNLEELLFPVIDLDTVQRINTEV